MANNKKLKKAVKKAAKDGNISRKEMKRIMQIAPTAAKAVNQIAKSGATVRTSAANYAVEQARTNPQLQYSVKPVFGSSNLGETLGSMAAVPGYKPTSSGLDLFIKGQRLDSKGRVVTGRPVKQVTPTPTTPTEPTTEPTTPEVENIYQQQIDNLINQINAMEEGFTASYQDLVNQNQMQMEQQMAQMSEMFNAQIAQQEQAYAQQIAQQNALAQQEQEAARAFMINQGRMVSPANLQIGSLYNTPKLAGTQGFKVPKTTTTPVAPMPTAFTAPTLAAAATQQPVQPTVLNV